MPATVQDTLLGGRVRLDIPAQEVEYRWALALSSLLRTG